MATVPAATSLPLIADDALPAGFRYAAARAGIKPSGRPDLAYIAAAAGTRGAACFTTNRVAAAPVLIGREHLLASGGRVRAVVVNSGNANCATGEGGLAAARETCRAAAELLGCDPEEVIPSSTGIIGVPLPVEKITAALPALSGDLRSGGAGFSSFATAILTTDTRPKIAHRALEIGGRTVRIAGACKGAGMIYPRLAPVAPGPAHATMLAYILTDAAVEADALTALLSEGVEGSFNRISIDGDTSTNDTVLLLASGQSGVSVPPGDERFGDALTSLCQELALAILDDGEGVSHVVTLDISGAPSDADALTVAKAIAHSPLVKTAWAGRDPNWGRLASSIGGSGVLIDPARLDITLNELPVCENGGRAAQFSEQALHRAMSEPRFTIAVSLGLGSGRCRFWTTDLTAEYVRINADYSS